MLIFCFDFGVVSISFKLIGYKLDADIIADIIAKQNIAVSLLSVPQLINFGGSFSPIILAMHFTKAAINAKPDWVDFLLVEKLV